MTALQALTIYILVATAEDDDIPERLLHVMSVGISSPCQ